MQKHESKHDVIIKTCNICNSFNNQVHFDLIGINMINLLPGYVCDLIDLFT